MSQNRNVTLKNIKSQYYHNSICRDFCQQNWHIRLCFCKSPFSNFFMILHSLLWCLLMTREVRLC